MPSGLKSEITEGITPMNDVMKHFHSDEMRRARLVKIDVEGAERTVVGGLGILLTAGRPELEFVIELNPYRLEQVGSSAEEIVDIFRVAGFHAYAIANDYSFVSYFQPRRVVGPVRIRGPIAKQQIDRRHILADERR